MATDLENYSSLIDDIFGLGATTFDKTKDTYNHVIGALNNPTQYLNFKANFKARLIRLKNIYSHKPEYLKEIIVQVNEVASINNWQGAFAEIAAFDYLNNDILNNKIYIHTPIKPNVTIAKSKTFAQELGKSEANLDGHIEGLSLYFDIKCFKDNVEEILEGIYKELAQFLGRADFAISPEYALDISYDDFQLKRGDLLAELKREIVPNKTTRLKSKIIPHLSFKILWGSGILQAERTYDPFVHATNYHKSIFNYANKFVKNKSSIIVLVVFPWYNLVVSDFVNSNLKMYRAFSRRVFCQYKHDRTKFRSFNSKFLGNQTIYKVSKNLSGIVFLEDNSILSNDPDTTNVKSFVYFNPNALKPLARSMAGRFLLELRY